MQGRRSFSARNPAAASVAITEGSLPALPLMLGQLYAPPASLAAAASCFLEPLGRVPAGVAIGLVVAVKPHISLWAHLLLVACTRPRVANPALPPDAP